MKHLSLHGAYFSNSEEFRALMNGCRALEVLKFVEFHCGKGGMEMEIDLPDLKVFRFNSKNEFVYVSLSKNKLEVLEFRGMFFRGPDGCFFPEMKAVVCLEIDQWVGSCLRHKLQNNLRQYGERMNNIVRALRETRTLSLNEWCTAYLTTIADTLELPYFRNLKQLEISLWSIKGHVYIVIYLIKRSPFLESLKLQTYETFHEDILISRHLKHIEIRLFCGSDIEMKLVETFLASCPDLEQFRIKFAFRVSQHVKTRVREKAPTFPRLSPSAELTFGDYILGTIGGYNLGF